MRILVVDSGRGNHAALVHDLRDSLGLLPEDDLYWLGWHPPKEPLPVARHLVLGPSLRQLGVARQCETALSASEGDDIHAADMRDTTADPADNGLAEAQLEEQLPESAQPHHRPEGEHGAAGAVDPPAASHRPDAPPRSTGLTYLVKGTRNTLRRTWRPMKTRIVTSDRRPVQTVVGVVQAIYPGIEDRFGIAAYRSRSVTRMAAECDVIVSHDTRSQPATWLIGRRVTRPALVTGVAAARRVIAERRALGQALSSAEPAYTPEH